MSVLTIICAAFVFSSVAILLLRPVCERLGHVDHPGGRKRHDNSTPLSGGIAIAVAIVAIGAVSVPSMKFLGFAFGICTLLLLGAMDDRKHVPAVLRLAIQTVAVAVGMCLLGGVNIRWLGDLAGSGPIFLDQWSVAFTIFGAVGVINAVNMIDGLDGIAGSYAVLLIGVLLSLATSVGAASSVLLFLSIGSVLGFLIFNLRTPWQSTARVYLGDAGSLVLGYILVWFAIEASQSSAASIDPITIVWLFGLPLSDTGYLMLSRVARRKSPFTADRYHFHHLLLRAGLTPQKTLYAWLTVAASFMAVGVMGSLANVPEYAMFYGFLVAFGCYCVAVNRIWSRRTLRRSIAKARRQRTDIERGGAS